MRLRLNSLGLKLNLALLVFFLVLGAATAAFIFAGFNRTRDNASARSRVALEEQGKLALKALVAGVRESGDLRFESAADIGQRAARYMQDFTQTGVQPQYDLSRLVQTQDDVWYDPDPNRVSDVVVPNHVAQLTGPIQDDIIYSASLDAVYAALVENTPGELIEEAYHPTAITFVGVNGVGRYYPPIGIQDAVPAEFDTTYLPGKFGPEANPEHKTDWTTPYDDHLGQGLVITAQTPIYQGDVFRGIFEVDLSIDKLVDQLNEIKPTESGFAFYVDRNGDILHTSAYDLLTGEIESQRNPALAGVMDAMKADSNDDLATVEDVNLGGKDFFIAYIPMQTLGGSIGVAAPVDEVTAQAAAITSGIDDQANRTMIVVLGSMTALFGLALVGATYLNRRVLIRPIEALAAGTRAVAQGDFETHLSLRGDDELAALGRSFNQMTANVQREVRDREAAESQLAALFAAMTDAVLVVDDAGRYIRVPSTNAAPGLLPPQDLPGKYMREVMPAEQAGAFLETLREALRIQDTMTIEYPLLLDHETRWFSAAVSPMSEHEAVVVARDITDRVNARQELERQVAERTRQLTAMLEVSRNVASTLELQPLLELIIEQVETLAKYDRASLYLLEGGTLRLLASRVTEPGVSPPPPGHEYLIADIGSVWRHLSRGQTVVIADLHVEDETTTDLRKALGPGLARAAGGVHALLIVPLILNDQVLGMLALNHGEPGFYGEQHVQLVSAIAAQAAIAIENARLYERAQQLAALEERQRLARELHDSVSQALYGIALGARTARTLLDTTPERATEPVDYVLSLAEAGLAEMRALIFELRPESLETEGLVAALQKQTAAIRARYGLDVALDLSEEPSLSLAEKEVFYRVAQEALHNIVKHAHATRADVMLASDADSVRLEIRDNGRGFDTSQSFPGHMGLVSMTERAGSIGARVEIESESGGGTLVKIVRPANRP